MLRLLLDEHLSPRIARWLAARRQGLLVQSLQAWEGGAYLGARDELLLSAAREHGLTLVTYDRRTVVPLLKDWAERGISHGGVVFVSMRTLAPNDFRGLTNALLRLWESERRVDWTNRVVFLERASR